MEDSFIKLYRKLLEWEWYKNINTKTLFLHMLLKANWKDGRLEGKTIQRGSFVSSIQNLSDETSLTRSEVRTAIEHLKSTGEITSKGTNKNTVFTIHKFDFYQSGNERDHKQITNKSQTIDDPLTTIEERKKERKEEDISCSPEPEGERKRTERDNFEIIYSIYPKKVGKNKAFEHYRGWLKGRKIAGYDQKIKLSNKQMYTAVSRYVEEQKAAGTDLQFYKGFDSLMCKKILDYVEGYGWEE